MTLRVKSARLGIRSPIVLDVTRKSGTDGLFLAPSWAILSPALAARDKANRLTQLGHREEAARTMGQAWDWYVELYTAEMHMSWLENAKAWDRLLARPEVILACYCTDRAHCHTAILRADILPRHGAIDCGEVPTEPPKQGSLF